MMRINGFLLFFSVILITVTPFIHAKTIKSLSNVQEEFPITQCVSKILRQFIPCSTVINFIYINFDINNFIKDINNENCYSIFVRSFYNYNWITSHQTYIIACGNVTELSIGMSVMTRDAFWNPRAKIITHIPDVKYHEMKNVFDVFLNHRVYDVIFIKKDTGQDPAIYTYFPFENSFCGRGYNKVQLIASCKNDSSVDGFFPDKSSNGIRNCSFTVISNEDTPKIMQSGIKSPDGDEKIVGVEQYLLQSIADIEGFSLKYIITNPDQDFGVVLPNHTATGLLGELQNNKADICAGGFVLMKNRADVFDYVYGYNFGRFNLYTAAFNDPVWKKLYEEFDTETWILVCSCFCIFIIICSLIMKIPLTLLSQTNLALKLWGFLYMGNSSDSLLQITRLRAILACWIWLTFFISNFYTIAVFSLITAHVKNKRYINPENLEKLSLKPCISDSVRIFFLFAYNHSLPENVPDPACRYTESSLDTVASSTDLYAIEMTYSYILRQNRYIDEEGNDKLDAWDFSTDTLITLYLSKGFPIYEKLWQAAVTIFESGILQKYIDHLQYKTHILSHRKTKTFHKLRLLDLNNHYIVLISGTVVSTLFFILEVYFKKY